jgi:hypothetical protein
VESSNRIEGVIIPADRLRPVVLGKDKPRNRKRSTQDTGKKSKLNLTTGFHPTIGAMVIIMPTA